VLFVCSGNSARSPIAEALLRHRAGARVRVCSAGTRPRERIHPHAVRVLRERYGLDIAGQRPHSVDGVLDRPFDRVVTVCDRAREVLPEVAGWPRTHWSIPDPAAGTDDPGSYPLFESVAADLDVRLRHLLPTLGRSAEGDQE
jgi:ArsR family transcriptional regulator, arsenate/arsenite/antimonite-responsive transcriptional repressor / arsenate reductase (thioredoxin)